MTNLRTILIALAVLSLVSACLLVDGSPVAANMFIKEKIALRVILFGLSAILAAVWFYLYDLSKKASPSVEDEV